MRKLTFNRLTHHSFGEEYALFKSVYNKLLFDEEITEEDVGHRAPNAGTPVAGGRICESKDVSRSLTRSESRPVERRV